MKKEPFSHQSVLFNMKIIFYIMLLVSTTACASSKSTNHSSKEISEDTTKQKAQTIEDDSVIITIHHYTPYCGGAAPSQDILARQNQAQRNTTFLLINLETNKKTEVKTDSNGVLKLKLPDGKYGIKEKYKDCSFKEFMEQYEKETGQNYIPNNDSDCYKKWWMSNLGEFEITASSPIQEFNWQTRSACFVGRNPCVNYIGPWPP